jgi:hypothetical protein
LNTKRNFWIRVIGSPVFFAAAMVFTSNTRLSWQQQILSFLTLTATYGMAMHWIDYRKHKPKAP